MSSEAPRGSNLLVWLLGLFTIGGATLFALPHATNPPKLAREPVKDAKPADAPAPAGAAPKTLQVLYDQFVAEKPPAEPAPRSFFGLVLGGTSADPAGVLPLSEYLKRVHHDHTYEYEFLIATVPDPVGSRFAHEFDAAVDGIQRAYEARGFLLRAAQLPWPRPLARDTAEVRITRTVPDQPGVLLFRQSRDPKGAKRNDAVVYRFAVVCLVGEHPIAGIHRTALTEALKAREDLAGAIRAAHGPGTNVVWAGGVGAEPPGAVQLVTPFFTGSQTSLLFTLDQWKKQKGNGATRFKIVNGSATGMRRSSFEQWHVVDPNSKQLESTVIPSDLLLRGVLRYLAGSRDARLDGTPGEPIRERIAFLREVNTGFGEISRGNLDPSDRTTDTRLPLAADNKPLDLPFPISISQLPALLDGTDKPHVALPQTEFVEPRLPLRDQTRFDPVPSYDPESAASTAGQSLRSIMSTIDRARVRYVGIVASDTRDVVFLNRLLKKECPNVRVFTTEPGIALLHPDEANWLRGMLVASTYPLSPSTQYWGRTPYAPRRMLPFPTQGSQGYYNAVLAQHERHDLMLGYHPPKISGNGRGLNRPPIWISVIGQGGRLVPVHCFTEYAEEEHHAPVLRAEVTPEVDAAQPEKRFAIGDELYPTEFPRVGVSSGAMLGALIAAVALGLVVLAAAAPRVWRKLASGVTDTERGVYNLGDSCWVWVWRGVVLAGALFFALPYALPARDFPTLVTQFHSLRDWRHWVVGLLAAVVLIEAVLAFVLFTWRGCRPWPESPEFTKALGTANTDEERERRKHDAKQDWKQGRFAFFALAVLVLGSVSATFSWWCGRHDVERFFVYVRATELSAGMSPLVPMGLLGLIAVVIGWCCLQQADIARRAQLKCPYSPVWSRLRSADKELTHDLRDHFRFLGETRHLTITLGLGVPFVLCCFWNVVIIPLPSGEGPTWDILMRVMFWILAGAVVFVLARFLAIWTRLARLLEEILRVPMVGAFERLPHEIGRLFGGYLYSQRPRHRQLAAVAWALPPTEREELAKQIKRKRPGLSWVFGYPVPNPDERPRDAGEPGAAARAEAEAEAERNDQEDRKWLADELQGYANDYLKELPTVWRNRSVDDAFGAERAPGSSGAEKEKVYEKPPAAPAQQKEQYVAVFVVMYLGAYFAQLRMLAYAIAFGAPLLLFAAASYPFQPDRSRLTVLLGLLLLVALGTVYVLYRINKDGLVSRIARTTPGRFTPDSGFLSSVATYVLPILALVVLELLGLFRFIIEPVLGIFE